MKIIIIAYILSAGLSYLLGSINSAILASRLLKQDDIRKYGSGNAGVTNMYRVYGRLPAVITILGDFTKSALAVVLARFMVMALGVSFGYDPGYWAGLFAIVGHNFPLFFRFKGGKGVMSLISVLFFVNLPLLGMMVAVTLPVLLVTRTMSLGAIIGTIVMPIAGFFLAQALQRNVLAITLHLLAYAGLIIIAHRDNIKRLMAGKEHSISSTSYKG